MECSLVKISYISKLCIILLHLFLKSYNVTSLSSSNKLSTSVWCLDNKLCAFQHLCFHPESRQFLFVLSPSSTFHNIDLTRMNSLQLSSVSNHNRFFMNIAVVSQNNEMIQSSIYKDDMLYVINSFKRDNIMHVIHDDLLPIFSTYQLLCSGDVQTCVNRYHLGFINDKELGPYGNWYRIFSKEEPVLLSIIDTESPVICYKEVRVGLTQTSLWFDYGFLGVQGRLSSSMLSGNILRQFRDYVLSHMSVQEESDGCAVFMKRTVNRRIINEDFVKGVIVEALKLIPRKKPCLIEVDMLKDNGEKLLSAIHKAPLLVGMHGAGMILALFLPIGASIVEMFPFGIEPLNVSPVMAMCDLTNVALHYSSWCNLNRSLSLPPSSTDPLTGSISHLSVDQQNEILKLEKVPAVKCCHDPAYLFYMFQDTVISQDFSKTVVSVLKRSQDFYIDDFVFDSYVSLKKTWMFPSQVHNIGCSYDNDNSIIEVSWNEPVNSAEFEDIDYDVTVSVSGKQLLSTIAKLSHIQISSIQPHEKLQIWVSSKDVQRQSVSKDVYYECGFHSHN